LKCCGVIVVLILGTLTVTACVNKQPDPGVSTVEDRQNSAQTAPPKLTESQAFRSNLIGQSVRYDIYLPPSYDRDGSRKYPVVYWLHGSGGFTPRILNTLASRFDKAIRQGAIPDVIVVFADGLGESLWVNSKDGSAPVEDIVITELIPFIDASYRTIDHGDGRIIEGGSMGGYGAARLGFKYPERFAAVSMLNPGPMQQHYDVTKTPRKSPEQAQAIFDRVYGGDASYFEAESPWQLAKKNTAQIASKLKVRMILGGADSITSNNQLLSAHLSRLGIDHEVKILEGVGHNPAAMFASLGPDYWAFFAEALRTEH